MAARKPKAWDKYLTAVIVLVGALLLAVFMEFLPWFGQLDMATYDFIFSVRDRQPPMPDLAIVSIDENSQQVIGPLPWPRSYYAALLRKLKEGGAKVAVLDVLFDQPKDPADDQDLARAISEFGKVVLGKDISRSVDSQIAMEITIEPLQIFLDAGASPGFVPTPTDPDTKIRSAFWQVNGQSTLATEAYRLYTGQGIRIDGDRAYVGDYSIPLDASAGRASFTIHFTGPSRTIPTRSFYQVLEGTIPRGFLENKVVFIGADLAADNRTGGPAVDRFPTPVDVEKILMPGVEIHANAFNTLATRSFIRTASPAVIAILLLFFAVATTLFCTSLRPVAAGVATSLLFVGATFAVYFIFNTYNYWLPPVRPAAMIALIYTGNTLAQYRLAVRERAQISKAFKHYVSAEVLGELMKNPDGLGLGGQEVEATVIFTDIAGFSKLSEKITPQELTAMLNQYFELLAGVIMKEGGMVNKFIGDAVMAIWGAPLENPDHAAQACSAALQMHRAMLIMDPIKCRIGINTGRMIAGNMGSRERFEYTVIGDAVNLASRLEGVNKLYQTDVIISEMTEEKVHGKFLLRDVDMIRVVGKQEPVRIFQLIDSMQSRGKPEFERAAEMTDSFNSGLAAYRNRDWTAGTQEFQQHCVLFPEDAVGKIYLGRCRRFAAEPPPADWDGVYQMETK